MLVELSNRDYRVINAATHYQSLMIKLADVIHDTWSNRADTEKGIDVKGS